MFPECAAPIMLDSNIGNTHYEWQRAGFAPVQAGQGRSNVYAAIVSGVSIRSQAPRTALCASGCRWA